MAPFICGKDTEWMEGDELPSAKAQGGDRGTLREDRGGYSRLIGGICRGDAGALFREVVTAGRSGVRISHPSVALTSKS